jgi:hypothetical protein
VIDSTDQPPILRPKTTEEIVADFGLTLAHPWTPERVPTRLKLVGSADPLVLDYKIDAKYADGRHEELEPSVWKGDHFGGFSWGYMGTGPHELARNLCFLYSGGDLGFALRAAHDLVDDLIADTGIEAYWSGGLLTTWCRGKRREHFTAEEGHWHTSLTRTVYADDPEYPALLAAMDDPNGDPELYFAGDVQMTSAPARPPLTEAEQAEEAFYIRNLANRRGGNTGHGTTGTPPS